MLLQGPVRLQEMRIRCVRGEDALEVFPNFTVEGPAEGGECVQGGLGEDGEVRVDGREGGEAIVGGEYG